MKPVCAKLAQIADGKFYRATDTESLASIYQDIDKLEKNHDQRPGNINNTATYSRCVSRPVVDC